ncbi:MAG TPA: MarR family transcriptional regulator [Burkholderiaceae bacterium]|nr:MarR family transcriptional regulator [Burkholderiaceae bacterium]
MTKKEDLYTPELDLENRISYRFAMHAETSMRCLAAMFTKKYSLTVAGWQVLAVIGRFEPMFPTDVAARTSMHADKVTRTVDVLVRNRWVAREPDTEDRRRIILKLTAKGKQTYEEIDRVRRILETEVLGRLSAQERRVFFQALGKIEAATRELFPDRDSWKTVVKNYESRHG